MSRSESAQYSTFDDFGLSENILRGIYGYGYERPSTIQQKAIPEMMSGNDVIGQAPSGCGKTASFTIGLLSKIDPSVQELQGLILSPTRELSIQIHRVALCLADYMGIDVGLMIGGQPDVGSKNSQVIVGTVGRVIDNLERKKMSLEHVKVFVLDETDEMLSEGFLEQIKRILLNLPEKTQIGIFSATLNQQIIDLSKRFMNNPVEILVEPKDLTLDGINQLRIDCRNDKDKTDVLLDIFPRLLSSQVMIYFNSIKKLEQVAEELKKNEFDVAILTGEATQKERNDIMKNFRSGIHRILLTTNILARGIDVQQVSIVINYEIPRDVETYLHRIGRSGRFGRKGVAINLVAKYELDLLQKIERHYKITIGNMLNDSI